MKIRPALTALALAASLAAPALAETVYLSAGSLVDPAAGKTVKDAAFIITDGRITARGTKSTLPAPGMPMSLNSVAPPRFCPASSTCTST